MGRLGANNRVRRVSLTFEGELFPAKFVIVNASTHLLNYMYKSQGERYGRVT